jgi:hypothetical protein
MDVPLHESVESDPIDPAGLREKVEQPRPRAGFQPLDPFQHRVEAAGHVECGPVGEGDAVVGIELDQVEVALERAADLGEEGAQIVGHEQERRAGVEPEPL